MDGRCMWEKGLRVECGGGEGGVECLQMKSFYRWRDLMNR